MTQNTYIKHQSQKVRFMRRFVDWMDDYGWFQKIFFFFGFFTVRFIFPLQYLLLRELMSCKSILDLGCGRHSMVPIAPSPIYKVGVELFESAYQEAFQSGRHDKVIQTDLMQVQFEEKSFDAVVMLDVLEHLTKEEGELLIHRMEQWARKKIIIFTPNGFVHQECYDHNPLMEHKSGWKNEEFVKKDFKTYGVRGFKFLYPSSVHPDEEKPTLWSRLCDLTQALTYFIPNHSFQLFCVKTFKPEK